MRVDSSKRLLLFLLVVASVTKAAKGQGSLRGLSEGTVVPTSSESLNDEDATMIPTSETSTDANVDNSDQEVPLQEQEQAQEEYPPEEYPPEANPPQEPSADSESANNDNTTTAPSESPKITSNAPTTAATAPPTTVAPVPTMNSSDNQSMTTTTTALPPPPINDQCHNALGPLRVDSLSSTTAMTSELLVSGTTVGATVNQVSECKGVSVSSPGVWYYTIGDGAALTASTCWPGTELDTKLSIFKGNCTAGNGGALLQCVTANDDVSSIAGSACDGNQLASRITWLTNPGEIYYILVHAFSDKMGTFEINVAAKNEQCSYAHLMAVGDQRSGDTQGTLTPWGGQVQRCADTGDGLIGDGPALWYKVVGTGTTLEATTCQQEGRTDGNTMRLHVLEASCDAEDSCLGGDNPQNGCPTYQWDTTPGTEYYIVVHSSSVQTEGDFVLSIREF